MWDFVDRRRVVPSSLLLLASVLLAISLFVPWGHTSDAQIVPDPDPVVYYSPWGFLAAFLGGPPSIASQPHDNLGVLIAVLWDVALLGPPLFFAVAAILRLCLSGLHRGWEIAIIILTIALGLLSLAVAGFLSIIFSLSTFDREYLTYITDRGVLFSLAGSACAVLAGIAFAVPSRRYRTLYKRLVQADAS